MATEDGGNSIQQETSGQLASLPGRPGVRNQGSVGRALASGVPQARSQVTPRTIRPPGGQGCKWRRN
eukprot:9663182-Alexandrium_andersonii.AAC.1